MCHQNASRGDFRRKAAAESKSLSLLHLRVFCVCWRRTIQSSTTKRCLRTSSQEAQGARATWISIILRFINTNAFFPHVHPHTDSTLTYEHTCRQNQYCVCVQSYLFYIGTCASSGKGPIVTLHQWRSACIYVSVLCFLSVRI